MNTFLPEPDLLLSARSLDDRRLGKQRVECIQLLLALWHPQRTHYSALWDALGYATCDPSRSKPPAYASHPCTWMWRGHESALGAYLLACMSAWADRGFSNSRCDLFAEVCGLRKCFDFELPPWFGGAIHANHRGLLKHKAPDWYSRWGWLEAPCDKAWWPGDV